jgi:hypothetical protein
MDTLQAVLDCKTTIHYTSQLPSSKEGYQPGRGGIETTTHRQVEPGYQY